MQYEVCYPQTVLVCGVGHKIRAIKTLKYLFNLGLKEAKEAFECDEGILMTEGDFALLQIVWKSHAKECQLFYDAFKLHKPKPPIDLVRI